MDRNKKETNYLIQLLQLEAEKLGVNPPVRKDRPLESFTLTNSRELFTPRYITPALGDLWPTELLKYK